MCVCGGGGGGGFHPVRKRSLDVFLALPLTLWASDFPPYDKVDEYNGIKQREQICTQWW